MIYTINAKCLSGRNAAHDEIARILELPAHYGRNLDALWDVLSTLKGEIVLENASAITGYGEAILQILRETENENPHLQLTIKA